MKSLQLVALGAAVASVVNIATAAFAGTGVGAVFNLGQTNSVNAKSTLTGSSSGSQLQVSNKSVGQTAVRGDSAGPGIGVRGSSPTGAGLVGYSTDGFGVSGTHASPTGAKAGVYGSTASAGNAAAGVTGAATATSYPGGGAPTTKPTGVLGSTSLSFATGVRAVSSGSFGQGVLADASAGFGQAVVGNANGSFGNGVVGIASGSFGIGGVFTGTGGYGRGIQAAGGQYAGFFSGNVEVQGNLHATGGITTGTAQTRVDDPLDPAHKSVQHSFIASPEMKNVYDGVTKTDARGFATVRLPRWFQALNRSFRYQLTPFGTRDRFVQAMVVKDIADNRFTFQTSSPRVRVSWQVTGIRNDAYANAHPMAVVTKKPKPAHARVTRLDR